MLILLLPHDWIGYSTIIVSVLFYQKVILFNSARGPAIFKIELFLKIGTDDSRSDIHTKDTFAVNTNFISSLFVETWKITVDRNFTSFVSKTESASRRLNFY